MFVLTSDQIKAKGVILQSIEPKNGSALLTGYAGTGKSTLLVDLVKTIQRSGLRVTVACPTHKACAVIRGILRDRCTQVDTIHKVFGMRIISGANGINRCTKPSRHCRGVLIVDESSMLSVDLMASIEPYIERVVYVGDPAQLPPVDSDRSPVFDKDVPRGHLEKVIRQKSDNPILELATWVRRKIERGEGITVRELIEMAEVVDPLERNIAREPRHMIPGLISEAQKEGLDARMIGYTNVCTNKAAHEIKREITGASEMFSKGDPVFFNAPKFDHNDKIKVDNNMEDFVISGSERLRDERSGLDYYQVQLSKLGSFKVPCDLGVYRSLLKSVQEKAGQHTLFSHDHAALLRHLKSEFADIRINHAMTIHKSQGSTFDCVAVDLRDVFGMRENLLQGLYVAITRPSKYLVLGC